MKSRSRKNSRRFGSPHRKPLGLLNIGKSHKRKSWTFERLEDRLVFSVDARAIADVATCKR